MSKDKPIDLAFDGIQATQYHDSFAAPKTVSGGEALNAYVGSYPSGNSFLQDTYLPGAKPDAKDQKDRGVSLGAQLKESENDPAKKANVAAVRNTLQGIFNASKAALPVLQTDFNDTYKGLSEKVKAGKNDADPKGFQIIQIPKLIEAMQEDTLKTIKDIQDKELKALKTWLADPQTTPQLQSAFPDSTPEVIEKQLISKMEATHKAQTDTITKTLEKAHEEQYKHLGQERERINLLRWAAARSEDMKDKIKKENAAHIQGPTVVAGGNDPSNQYAGVALDKIEGLTTITLNGVHKNSITFPGSSLTRQLSYVLPFLQIFPGPFGDFKKQDFQDLLWLAKKTRADGSRTITMTISSDNPAMTEAEYLRLGEDCVEACVLAGFKKEDVIIKAPQKGNDGKEKLEVRWGLDDSDKNVVEGEKKIRRISDLFKNNPSRLEEIEKMGERVRAAEKDALDPRKTQKHYKDVVDQLRTFGAQGPQAAAAAAAAPGAAAPAPFVVRGP
jgi:hypothetical protein